MKKLYFIARESDGMILSDFHKSKQPLGAILSVGEKIVEIDETEPHFHELYSSAL